MTVAYLWDSIEAGGEPLTDDALRGRTLAVDLSIWIVEARSSTALARQHANPHLFLALSRALFLMRRGVELVFVLEGERSPLKRVHARVRCTASQFEQWTSECRQVLEALGLPCVRADAEAEATCAAMSSLALVDGVITNDADAFLYGARAVIKGFSISEMKRGAARVFRAGLLHHAFAADTPDLVHRRLIAFALLVGSDLGVGVHGLGAAKALRFLRCVRSSEDPVAWLCQWRDGRGDAGAQIAAAIEQPAVREVRDRCSQTAPGSFPCEALLATYLHRPDATEAAALRNALRWRPPSLVAMNALRRTIVGHAPHRSATAIEPMLLRVQARCELLSGRAAVSERAASPRPQPTQLGRRVTRHERACVEVHWEAPLTAHEAARFVTIEWVDAVSAHYPELLARERRREAMAWLPRAAGDDGDGLGGDDEPAAAAPPARPREAPCDARRRDFVRAHLHHARDAPYDEARAAPAPSRDMRAIRHCLGRAAPSLPGKRAQTASRLTPPRPAAPLTHATTLSHAPAPDSVKSALAMSSPSSERYSGERRRARDEDQEGGRRPRCALCRRDATAVLLPCAHLVACAECAPRVARCPSCGEGVASHCRVGVHDVEQVASPPQRRLRTDSDADDASALACILAPSPPLPLCLRGRPSSAWSASYRDRASPRELNGGGVRLEPRLDEADLDVDLVSRTAGEVYWDRRLLGIAP